MTPEPPEAAPLREICDARRGYVHSVETGGTLNVTDSDLGLTASVRVVQIDRDILRPLQTRVTLSTRPLQLTTLLLTE